MHIIDPQTPADLCVIWMHGLGADGQDMASLARELPLPSAVVRHVCLDAPVRPVTINGSMPMRAWYDITGATLNSREDKAGILASEQVIQDVIQEQIAQGFASNAIVLAGFSQGGAMALFSGLRSKNPLGGVVALSAYLPLAQSFETPVNTSFPVFLALGTQDPLVQPAWTRQTKQWISTQGVTDVTLREYPIPHAVCQEEITDLAAWFTQHVLPQTASLGERT